MQLSYVYVLYEIIVDYSHIFVNITDYSSLFDEIQPGVLIRPYEYGARTDYMHFTSKDIEQCRLLFFLKKPFPLKERVKIPPQYSFCSICFLGKPRKVRAFRRDWANRAVEKIYDPKNRKNVKNRRKIEKMEFGAFCLAMVAMF